MRKSQHRDTGKHPVRLSSSALSVLGMAHDLTATSRFARSLQASSHQGSSRGAQKDVASRVWKQKRGKDFTNQKRIHDTRTCIQCTASATRRSVLKVHGNKVQKEKEKKGNSPIETLNSSLATSHRFHTFSFPRNDATSTSTARTRSISLLMSRSTSIWTRPAAA